MSLTDHPDGQPAVDPEDHHGGERPSTAPERVSEHAERQFEGVRRALSERRLALGITMSELARQVGVSPSMISQMESGRALPSVSTLFSIAAALGAQVDTFFAGSAAETSGMSGGAAPGVAAESSFLGSTSTPNEHRYVVRGMGRAQIDISGGIRWERLTPTQLAGPEFLELVYQPGARSDTTLYRHAGIEMVLVVEGAFRIDVGFESYDLAPGDSICFPSSLPHRYTNPTDGVARAVTLITRDSSESPTLPARHDPEIS